MKKNLKLFTLFIFLSTNYSCSNSVKINGETVKTIEDLTASDVHINFTNNGFNLQKNIGTESSSWICTYSDIKKDLSVDTFGATSTDIVNIFAKAKSTNKKDRASVSSDFLGFVASIPYKNSNPGQAKNWVISNIEKGGSLIIGSAKFELIVEDQYTISLIISGV